MPSRAHLTIFFLIAAFTLLIRGAYLGDPAADYDEQLYQFVGQQMLHGQLPFVDIWDRKPLGLFLIYAAANLIGGPGVWPYQLLACASTAWAAWLVFKLARQVSDSVGATAAALLYVFYLSAFGAYVGQSEVFYIPLLLCMVGYAIRLLKEDDQAAIVRIGVRLFALGGICLQIKYTVLPQCLLFGLVALWRLHRVGASPAALLMRAAQFALIGLLPTLLAAGFYWASGHLDAFVFANFTSIFMRGPLSGALKALYRDSVIIMSLPLLAGAIAGALKMAARCGIRVPTVYLVAGLWTASAAASALMVGNIYIHYFAPVVPGLVILAAPALSMSRLGAVLFSVAMVGATLFHSPLHHYRVSQKSRAGFDQVVTAVRPYVGQQHNCLYVFDGPTALYRDTHSCLPTRFLYPDHLNNEQEEHALGVDTAREVSRILGNRPAVIITASQPVVPRYNQGTAKLVSQAVARDYVRIGSFWYFPRRLFVNVRRDLVKDTPAEAAPAK